MVLTRQHVTAVPAAGIGSEQVGLLFSWLWFLSAALFVAQAHGPRAMGAHVGATVITVLPALPRATFSCPKAWTVS